MVSSSLIIFVPLALVSATEDCQADENTLLQHRLRNHDQASSVSTHHPLSESAPVETPQWGPVDPIPVGWTMFNENWNCEGNGQNNAAISPTAANNEECAQACGAEGHIIAAFWHNKRDMCRCYDSCDAGGATSATWPNTVMQKESPVYNLVHQGHCASGWISGSNTLQADIEACHVHCSENSECGYFAFAEGVSEGTNCGLYTPCGGCDDDNHWDQYNAYQMADRSCPAYNLVHQGHCASGWISGSNTLQADIEACHVHCKGNSECGYFAFAEGVSEGTNCGLYTACGGCDDDNHWDQYNAYQVTERSC